MIIYFNSNGDISSLKPERVYQGSNDVDQFLIVAPFNTASTVELTFTLPNGQVLPPYILSGGAIFTNELNIWSFLLKSDVTRFAGQIRFGVRVLGVNGKVLATGSDTFVVERGTAPTLPPEPTPDVYEQILELLGGLSVDKVDRVDVSDPDYIVGYVYSKDGIKTPNAFYYNFNADSVIGYNNQTLNDIKGAIFVLDIPTQLRQIEYLFADDLKSKPKIFTRQVYYDGNKEVTIVTPFVEIGWDIYGDLNNKVTDVLSQLGGKQDKTDNNLQTTSKEIVGAINSLNENINLITPKANGAVRFDVTQMLTDEQKERARVNIGVAGGDLKMIIVSELPETGEPNTVYLVPNEDAESSNLYIEWVSIGGNWEKWGSASIDLTEYFKKTDSLFGGTIDESGVITASEIFPELNGMPIRQIDKVLYNNVRFKYIGENPFTIIISNGGGEQGYQIIWGATQVLSQVAGPFSDYSFYESAEAMGLVFSYDYELIGGEVHPIDIVEFANIGLDDSVYFIDTTGNITGGSPYTFIANVEFKNLDHIEKTLDASNSFLTQGHVDTLGGGGDTGFELKMFKNDVIVINNDNATPITNLSGVVDLSNYVERNTLNGGTTGQILTKKSDSDLDVEWADIEIPTVNLNGVELLRDPAKTYVVIKTPIDNDIFTLLTGTTGSPNYTIDWGDGISENIIGTANPEHEYATAGMYLITISGSFTNGIVAGAVANPNKNKYIKVFAGSNYATTISANAFYDCGQLTTFRTVNVVPVGIQSFRNCQKLTDFEVEKISTTDSRSFEGIVPYFNSYITFNDFNSLTSLGIGSFSGTTSGDVYIDRLIFPLLTTINSNASYPTFGIFDFINYIYMPKITTIGNRAFSNIKINKLIIGKSLTSIDSNAFLNSKIGEIVIVGDPTELQVSTIISAIKASGAIIGNVNIVGNLQVEKAPTLDNDVVRKVDLTATNNSYDNTTSGLTADNVQDAIDELDNIKLDINGGTMSGDLDMSGGTISGLMDAVNSDEAVNKGQLDSAIANAEGIGLYDIIIKTQTQFDDLIASPTWLGAKSVAFIGLGGADTFITNTTITVPFTVRMLNGINDPVIIVNNSKLAMIGDASTSLNGLTITCNGLDNEIGNNAGNATAIEGFHYVTNCTLVAVAGENVSGSLSGIATGAYNCSYLVNCIARTYAFSGNSGNSCGFTDCYNLVNCKALVSASGDYGYAIGFNSCNMISNCEAEATSQNQFSYGFYTCSQVSNCTSKAITFSSTGFSGFGYDGCGHGSNNRDLGSTTGASNSNTKWSTETND